MGCCHGCEPWHHGCYWHEPPPYARVGPTRMRRRAPQRWTTTEEDLADYLEALEDEIVEIREELAARRPSGDEDTRPTARRGARDRASDEAARKG